MTYSPSTNGKLPDTMPIFPLEGAVLLPGGELPLNIFERRYLAMVDAALGQGRWIGMVQPRQNQGDKEDGIQTLFSIGCAGQISSFSATKDNRYFITLTGACRFSITTELEQADGFRRIKPDFTAFEDDLEPEPLDTRQRADLFRALKDYLGWSGYDADWDALENTPDHALVASMAMACPFAPAEKQALLEASSLVTRTRCLVTMLDMARHDEAETVDHARH
ncbi:MAG: hypothetical protein CBB68_08215 [Rhodospirillaceae bacterium TMED8]|nr:peptidase S16 [Magnetovibrio sp.]OUT50358.1 MAG: hypothetical protein CBB68_08215 [Rhodospirillaceae bacterium TMED8]|tara:strand:- start:3683 stop:4348 length:666 start_codon:yes stop_codon:yes gene_type:complete